MLLTSDQNAIIFRNRRNRVHVITMPVSSSAIYSAFSDNDRFIDDMDMISYLKSQKKSLICNEKGLKKAIRS